MKHYSWNMHLESMQPLPIQCPCNYPLYKLVWGTRMSASRFNVLSHTLSNSAKWHPVTECPCGPWITQVPRIWNIITGTNLEQVLAQTNHKASSTHIRTYMILYLSVTTGTNYHVCDRELGHFNSITLIPRRLLRSCACCMSCSRWASIGMETRMHPL